MSKATVNGNKQDIIITNSFKNSEFSKFNNKLPYSVLEYLFINKYSYSEIKEYFDHNDNIIMNFHNPDNVSENGELKVLSKFRINGDTLENLNPNNTKDRIFKLDLAELKLNSQTTKRGKYPFYAIITLSKSDDTFYVNDIDFLEAITIDIEEYKALRKKYTSQDWLNLIFSTIGYNPDTLTPFEKYSLLVRLIPFCIEQYHIIELGNKETAKSYFYSIMSDLIYSSSISAGSITMAKLVKNNSTNESGILATKNVVNFDEIPDAYMKDKDIVTTLQTYLQDGFANRDDGVIAGKASLVFTGNLNDFESSILKKESLFNHFRADIRNETIIDKLYFFSPGWKFTKINPNKYTEINAPRIRRDYFLCALNLMREESKDYSDIFKDTINFVETESGRDMRVVSTIAGLIMLLHPDIQSMSTEELEAFAYIALTGRKLLLRELEIKNNRQYSNKLKVENSKTNKKIKFEELSNFILNTSETLLKSNNIHIDTIEYYYLDYYKNYDITREINDEYGFELIEPTIAIKCTGNPNVYKLAVSSYGINMNILEVHESKTKNNVTCRNLTENFMLIETNEIKDNIEKLHIKKFKQPSINSLEELKEKYKKQPFMIDILNFLMVEQQNKLNLSNTIKTLENKIEIQNSKLSENQEVLTKLNSASTIKDILNLIFSSNIKTSNELLSLRNLLFYQQSEFVTKDVIHVSNFEYNLGNKIYIDNNKRYRHVYLGAITELKGKLYIDTNKFELFLPSNQLIIPQINKVQAIDNALEKHINAIDTILNYIQYNDLINLNSINYPKKNLENLNNTIRTLNFNVSNIKTLIDNFDAIKDLLKTLIAPSYFLTTEIFNYFNLLNDLLRNIETYINTYLPSNSQNSITSNIAQTIGDNEFINTIFNNEFISNLKNNQN